MFRILLISDFQVSAIITQGNGSPETKYYWGSMVISEGFER